MADNVVYSHQLKQTVDEIQAALDILTKNGKQDSTYMLVSDGSGKVKFEPKLRTSTSDPYLSINTETGLIALNYTVLVNNITNSVASSSAVEKGSNKLVEYNSGTNYADARYDINYPAVSFVAKLIQGAMTSTSSPIRNMAGTAGYNSVKSIIDRFKQKGLTNGTLYTTTVNEDENGVAIAVPTPCIFMQAGLPTTAGQHIGFLLLYGEVLIWIDGVVANDVAAVNIGSERIHAFNNMATVEYVNDLIFGSLDEEY